MPVLTIQMEKGIRMDLVQGGRMLVAPVYGELYRDGDPTGENGCVYIAVPEGEDNIVLTEGEIRRFLAYLDVARGAKVWIR